MSIEIFDSINDITAPMLVAKPVSELNVRCGPVHVSAPVGVCRGVSAGAEPACYPGAMTTSQRMDAIEMTQHRRRPFPQDEQAAAYLDMMSQVRQFQDTLVAANPDVAQAQLIQSKLAELTELLATLEVPEHARLYALGDMGIAASQALVPPLTVDHFDDDELHAHFVPGQFAMGMNQAMHGGVIAALFDSAMGRMAAGPQGIPSRTAYLNTQYRNVAPVGVRLELRAQVASIEGRKRFITAQILHGDTLCAEADALFVAVRPGHQ